MRHFYPLLITLTLTSCFAQSSENIEDIKKDDSEIIDKDYPHNRFILWNDLLTQTSDQYFAYVFSYDCRYCNSIKNEMILFSEKTDYDFYFIEYQKDIPLSNSISETIGKNDINSIFIKGTPTLLLLFDKEVFLNVAGVEEIKKVISIY